MSLLASHGGLGYLILLACQFGTQPFLAKHFVARGTLTSSLVLASDLGKIVICALVLCAEGRLREVLRTWTLRGFLLAAGAPSLTYLVQNFFIQEAYMMLDSVAFNILNQTKTLFAAVFVFLIVGRRQSPIQCFALLLVMVAGVLASQTEAASKALANAGSVNGANGHGSMSRGITFVLAASALSGLGAGMTEWSMTRQKRDNYLLSAELSLLGCILNISSLLLNLSPDAGTFREEGFFAKWSLLTLVPVLTQGVGGMLVGKVTQVAGSVKKGVAITGGLVLSCVLKCMATREGVSLNICMAVLLVGASIYLHSSHPPQRVAESKKAS